MCYNIHDATREREKEREREMEVERGRERQDCRLARHRADLPLSRELTPSMDGTTARWWPETD